MGCYRIRSAALLTLLGAEGTIQGEEEVDVGWRPSTLMDVKAGSSIDAWSASQVIDFQSRIISAECWDNNLNIRLSNDGTTYSDAFEVDVDRPFVFPFSAASLQVQNKTAGSNSRDQGAAGD